MSSSTNQNTNNRSMSGIISIDDGAGNTIEDGVISTNGIEVNGDINANNINVNQEITADIFSLSFPDSSSKFQIDDVRYISKYYDEIDNKYYINMYGLLRVDGDCKVTGDLRFPTESTGLNWNNYARIYYNGADLQIETDALMNITAPSGVNISSTVSAPRVTFSSTSPNMYIKTLNGNFMEFFNTTTETAGFGFYCGTEATPVEICRIESGGDLKFPNTGKGIKWGEGYSKIYDNGHLHIDTDDYMFMSAPNSVNISTPMVYTNGLVKADNYVISPTFRFLDDPSYNTYISWNHSTSYMDFTSYKGNFAWYYNFQNGITGNFCMTLNTAGVLDVPNTIKSTYLLTDYIQFKNETSGTTAIGVDTTNKYMTFLSYSGGYKWYYNYGIAGGGEMDLERTGVLSGLMGLQVSGTIKSQGYACNAGTTGTPSANMFNFNWATDNNGVLKVKSYIDTTKIGSLVVSDEDANIGGVTSLFMKSLYFRNDASNYTFINHNAGDHIDHTSKKGFRFWYNYPAGTNVLLDASGNLTGIKNLGAETITLNGTNLQTTLNSKASSASPSLTGTPTCSTPAINSVTSQITNCDWVSNQIFINIGRTFGVKFSGELRTTAPDTYYWQWNTNVGFIYYIDGSIVSRQTGFLTTIPVGTEVAGQKSFFIGFPYAQPNTNYYPPTDLDLFQVVGSGATADNLANSGTNAIMLRVTGRSTGYNSSGTTWTSGTRYCGFWCKIITLASNPNATTLSHTTNGYLNIQVSY